MNRLAGAALGIALAGALIALVLYQLERPPAGPVEPVWDLQACAHCRMHLTERGFAAQAHEADGTVHYFDDPGCLFAWQRAGGEAATVWFHHSHEPRWLAADEVAFVPAGASPMGFGLAAVDRGASPAMTVAEAQAHLAAAAAAAAGGGDATH